MATGFELDEHRLALAALALLALSGRGADSVCDASIEARWLEYLGDCGWVTRSSAHGDTWVLTAAGQRKAREVLQGQFSSRGLSPADVAPEHRPIEPARAIVLRCTVKLLRELRVAPQPVPEEYELDRDWHATIVRIQRRKCVLVSHSRTLFTVPLLAVKKPNFDQIGAEIGHRVQAALQREGLGEHHQVLPSVAPQVLFARTNDRSVLGSMSDLQRQLEHEVDRCGGIACVDTEALTRHLNDMPMVGTLRGKTALRAMTELLRPDLGAWYGQLRPEPE